MVDFSKAFDELVPHALSDMVHGRVLNVLRNMYEGFKACVRTPE